MHTRFSRLLMVLRIKNPRRHCGAVPEVQEDSRSVIISHHWLMAFSASPHFHWNPVLKAPPPSRRSTAAASTSPVLASVIFASAWAAPTNGYVSVARYLRLLTM